MLVDGPRDAQDDRCTLARHSSVALILVGDDCRVLLANPAAYDLLGATLPEAQGRRVCDLLGLAPAEEPAHAHRCPIARLVRGQERRNGPREVILTVAAERIPALLAVDRPASGAAGAIVSIMLLHHEERLQKQRRRVFARLLHDLRTPLSGIGLVTALLESGAAEMPHSVLDAVRMHHADLLRYVGELADYALLDLHTRLPPAQHVALDEVLEVVLWNVGPYARRRQQHLRSSGKVARPVLISQRHLEQALTAAVFDVSTCAPEGTPIQVRARPGADRTMVTVTGTVMGSGGCISPETIAALFDPYLRARRREDTLGLMSLAAGKQALEHYGGGLEVASKRGCLRIMLSLPLA